MSAAGKRQRATVAYIHANDLSASFHECLLNLGMYDAATIGAVAHDHGRFAVRCGTDGLVAARNLVVREFLRTDVEWLLWIDTDMGFAPDTLTRLLDVADPDKRPIVGALCFASREISPDGMGGYRTVPRPTIYQRVEIDGKRRFAGVTVYPVNDLVRCAATGSACILINRRVFATIGNSGWYDRLRDTDGSLLGEDISFCVRATAADFPIYVHTGVRTTHHKPQWIGEIDFWFTYTAPAAREQTAVIVPVMRRPQNAEPFMRSLRASTGLATAYAVCDPDDHDTQMAWEEAGAQVLVSDRGHTFPAKANYGYLHTTEPWLFFVGDDVRFHPGWLDHAQHIADVQHADVIATNDLGNPAVLRGEHATHPLIRRSYIDMHGATWDGPGVAAHEGYRHSYIDNEWTVVAQQRGTFAAALGSIVEHLHPAWGKAPDDDVYRRGLTNADKDRRLFERRMKVHTA